MKTLVSIDEWNRKEQFLFFSKFNEPFFGVTVHVDCTIAYKQAKSRGLSFFLYYLYRAIKAANEVENFRYRIHEGKVYVYDSINASAVINRPDGTFGFSYIDYNIDEQKFYQTATIEIENVRKSKTLLPATSSENLIHFSAIPWLNFTSISHARNYSFEDSCPKITFGKMTCQDNLKTMPVSIHVHHALADGYHVSTFIKKFQELLNEAK